MVVMVGVGTRGGLRRSDQARLVCSASAASGGASLRIDTYRFVPRDSCQQRRRSALAAFALLILAGETPSHWRFIDHSFRVERERSRPSYVLGMRARAAGEARGVTELFFDGVKLPTLVYYSGMRAHFVAVYSEAIPDLPFHQLVLRDADGTLATVGNLDDEWNLSGPPEERVPAENKGGRCRSAGESPPPNDLRLSMLVDDQADDQL
jgi:hypothetical protein